MFKSDQPIESCSEDILGRKSFAKALAATILSYKRPESIVLGLFGSWGTGKTSLVNMTLEQIAKKTPGMTTPIIVPFNPWNYSDQDQLITQFFRALSVALQNPDYAQNAQDAGRRLQAYAEFFKPLALIPSITPLALILSTVMKSFGTVVRQWGEAREKDLDSVRRQLNNLLKNQPHKIIVVIDDIDRLNNTEIRQMFQLVKSLGDFPNTVYFLSFDREVVVRALEQVQKGDGNDYLEKVVQIPFPVPLVPKTEIERFLFRNLDEVLGTPDERWNQGHWQNVYQDLRHFFCTIRDVTRYINSLGFGFEMVKEEVNPVDFVAITALQVFAPEVYEGIRVNKDLFVGIHDTDHGLREEQKKELRARWEEIANRGKEFHREHVLSLLKKVFPKVHDIYGFGGGYGDDSMGTWRRECRVCSPDVFEAYFRLALPEGEISRKEMEAILASAGISSAFTDVLLQLNKDNRIVRFLERMEDYTRKDIPKENIASIITVLMDLGDLFPSDEDKSFWGFDTRMRLLRLFHQLITLYGTQEERFKILKCAVNEAEQSLYTLVDEVGVLGQEHGKFGNKEKLKPEEERTVSLSQLGELESIAVKKIRIWAKEGKLMTTPRPLGVLYSWTEWGGKDEAQRFVEEMTRMDKGLIEFLTAFLSKQRSVSLHTGVAKVNWRMDTKSLGGWLDIGEVKKRVSRIAVSPGELVLTEQNKLAIQVLLDKLEGKSDHDW